MYRKIMLLFGIVGVSLSLTLGLLDVITWQIVPVLITVSLGIPSLILTYEKLTSEVKVKPKENENKQEVKTEEKEILREETIRVSPNDEFYYEVELTRGDNLKGKISSSSHIDIYFVNDANFKKWEKIKNLPMNIATNLFLKPI